MKLFTNLPGNLRALFGALRLLSVIFSVFWLLAALLGPWVTNRFQSKPNLVVALGEVTLQPEHGAVELKPDSAPPGSMELKPLHGTLQIDIGSNDAALTSAVRRTLIPTVLLYAVFSWVMFGSLRCVCANIERGDIFSEKNLRLIRSIGLTLLGYSVAGLPLGMWGSHVMSDYLSQHVVLTGLGGGVHLPAMTGATFFSLSPALMSSTGGFVTGLLVLVVAEAFRQGLNLKNENDLTV
jgi:hypothetical protein